MVCLAAYAAFVGGMCKPAAGQSSDSLRRPVVQRAPHVREGLQAQRRRAPRSVVAPEQAGLRESALIVPAMQTLDENQQAHDAVIARQRDPYAAAERRASQTAYAALTPEEAARIDGEAFPHVINDL